MSRNTTIGSTRPAAWAGRYDAIVVTIGGCRHRREDRGIGRLHVVQRRLQEPREQPCAEGADGDAGDAEDQPPSDHERANVPLRRAADDFVVLSDIASLAETLADRILARPELFGHGLAGPTFRSGARHPQNG